ncbi:MAG: helix-turn-helix transcriptional regulator [Mycobacteriaceae bacterium]
MSETIRRNLDKQREYYGELFGERARRLVVGFDISQAHLAEVLGVSAPMLSQVMSGRRQKMANPAVWARLVLLERTLQTATGHEELRDGLAKVQEADAAEAILRAANPGRAGLVLGLGEVCTGDVLSECAELVAATSPDLAQLLAQAASAAP